MVGIQPVGELDLVGRFLLLQRLVLLLDVSELISYSAPS